VYEVKFGECEGRQAGPLEEESDTQTKPKQARAFSFAVKRGRG
jgi:hypothetical protein